MQVIYFPIRSTEEFNNAIKIINQEFPESDNYKLSGYFEHSGSVFTHAGLSKDGNLFPTNLSPGKRLAPSNKLCSVDELPKYIKSLHEKGNILCKEDVLEILIDFKNNNGGIDDLIKAIEYDNEFELADIKIGLLLDILYVNGKVDGDKRKDIMFYLPIITTIVSNSWLELDKYVCIFAGTHQKGIELASELSTGYILELLKEFTFGEDVKNKNKIQIKLTENLKGDIKLSFYRNLVDVILIKNGGRRKNALQFYPIITLILAKIWVDLPQS